MPIVVATLETLGKECAHDPDEQGERGRGQEQSDQDPCDHLGGDGHEAPCLPFCVLVLYPAPHEYATARFRVN
jgi:hypothetical protein